MEEVKPIKNRRMVGFWEAQAIFLQQLEEAGRSLKAQEKSKKAEKQKKRQESWNRVMNNMSSCFRAKKEGIFKSYNS